MWLLFYFLCATITANSQISFNEADELMTKGQYRQANLAYEWIAYQSDNPSETSKARLGRARALKYLGEYERADEVLSAINILSANHEYRSAIVYEQVLIKYLLSDYQGSISKGLFGQSLIQEGQYRLPYLLLMSISNYRLEHFDEGKRYGKQYCSLFDLLHDSNIHPIFDSLSSRSIPVLKNPEKAGNLSTFLPGVGQMYAGNTGEGLLSLGLHGISITGAVFAALGGYYISAWLGLAIIVQRLNKGGRLRAVELTAKKNRLEVNKYTQPIIDFLITSGPST